jgi:hypothetical protein
MMLTKSSLIISIPTAAPFVNIIKVLAWFFETNPEGMGLFLELTLSRSVSIRSFKTYIPTEIINVIRGSGMVVCISIWMSVSEVIVFRIPGMQNSPATVAME